MSKKNAAIRDLWQESFQEQIALQAYNTAPVESLIRNISYFFRDRFTQEELKKLHFLEMGSGAGPNLIWLAQKGVKVSGLDISPTALKLSTDALTAAGYKDRIGSFVEGSVTDAPFPDASFDGIIESCVFQHLSKEDRLKAFAEVTRLLKPGGLFVGHMLSQEHSIYQQKHSEELKDDPGTLILQEGGSKVYLSNIGLSHFYGEEELKTLLKGFRDVDLCTATYTIPRSEAQKRGYSYYRQGMWIVYAIK